MDLWLIIACAVAGVIAGAAGVALYLGQRREQAGKDWHKR